MLSELVEVVRSVGELLLKWRKSGIIYGKWEGSQFKAEADLMANDKLIEKLSNFAPDIPIISEENQSSWVAERPERYWLIDPIDGTASFAHGYSGFVTQIALVIGHAPTIAVIYAPDNKCLYTAEKGKGAFKNGTRLVRKQTLPKILIDNYPEPLGVTLQAYTEFDFKHYIECGSIALKICKVADGTADLFFKDVTVRDWDLAAPQLVLEEANGYLRDIRGNLIEYTNGYERTGLVASCCTDSISRLVSWYANMNRR